MFKLNVGYKTGSGNYLTLTVYGEGYDRDAIPLFYPAEDLIKLCGDCKGYSGGCPGHAPYFDQIKPSMPYFYVLSVWIDIAWGIEYSGGPDYFKFRYVDRITSNYMLRITRNIDEMLDAFRLVTGGCNACKGECVVLSGQRCARPRLRTYSVEAVGVDCSELHRLMFGSRLVYWYYDGALPHYMVRYGGFFVRSLEGMDTVLSAAMAADKSFTTHLESTPSYRLVIREAPEHVIDAGLRYEAYEKGEDGNYG